MKKAILNSLIILAGLSSSAFAAANTAGQGSSFLLTLFIGFFALIIVFQLVPATLLLVGMLKGLLTREHKAENQLN